MNRDIDDVSANAQEHAQITEIAKLTGALLDQRYTSVNKPKLRAVHPKSHGCVHASFIINSDLAAEYQQGLFSQVGKTHEALVRFSNASALVQADITDGKHGSRGAAIKIFLTNTSEPMLQKDEGISTQDFLMINTPSFAFSNVPDYLRLTQVIAQDKDNPAGFFAPLANPRGFTQQQIASTKKTFGLIQQITSIPVADPLQIKYFGAAPFKFGNDKVMRFAIVPSGEPVEQRAPSNPSPNYLREVLKKRLSGEKPIFFDFVAQVRHKNEPDLMLEDASSHWDESRFPFIPLAKVKIAARQIDFDSPQNEARCEDLKFSPWHSLKAHQPLGGINRLRKAVYDTSTQSRLSGQLSPSSARSSVFRDDI